MATPSPEQLAALIDRLDHPDAIFQRELMDNLVSLGPEIIPNLAANLSMAEPNVKTCLVRILAEIGDASRGVSVRAKTVAFTLLSLSVI